MTTSPTPARGARTAGIVGAFTTVRTVGGLLPADTLIAVAAASRDLPGLTPADYGLVGKETLREAANRSFTRLQAAWADFRRAVPAGPVWGTETTPTRRWLQVLFTELGYGRLPTAPAGGIVVDSASGSRGYPVSHLWGRSPIHLLGAGISLDHRTAGVAGAAASAPHSMVQELLNRAPDLLWGFVSNGLRLRLLRDSASLVRQAYVEFDLEAMFDGDVFADFALLWLVAHASRVEPRPDSDARPDTCWLEKWRTEGLNRGTRALTALRDGVAQALVTLGRGFLRHPDNTELRTALADGTLPSREYYRLLLRVVYQLLILFVAEDRDLLHPPGAAPSTRDTYARYFSTDRLRRLSRRRSGVSGARHHDLWTAHQLVLAGLGDENGRPELGLPGLGGIYEPELLGLLSTATITNVDLLAAVRALSVTRDDSGLPRQVDYRNLGAEELGGIYESLLELVPQYDAASGEFGLDVAAGHDRKTTGSYYTPPGLVEIVLDEALDPVLDDAEKSGTTMEEKEKALLAVTVCDPACGSGHFLAAAARRIAHRLAAVRTGEAEPPVAATQTAMRDVVAHCIYGVDLNPMAAELAKVALWLEGLDPGRPLSFLDAHIKVGNALVGTTPDLVARGVPDDAFTTKTGDDRGQITAFRKRNRDERKIIESRIRALPWAEDASGVWRQAFQELADLPEEDLASVHAKEIAWETAEAEPEINRAKLAADAWCAVFCWPHRVDREAADRRHALFAGPENRDKKPRGWLGPLEARFDPPPPTSETIRRVCEVGEEALTPDQFQIVEKLRSRYRYFHWSLEFPAVMPGGFSCVIGNPPWERVKLQDEEFFAARAPDIANASTRAVRKVMIAKLENERPALWNEYQHALRDSEIASVLGRGSGRYPLTGRGDINTFQLFAEHGLSIVENRGRLGMILPSNIATGDTTAPYFRHLIATSRLVGFFDFENEEQIFPGVNNRVNFALLIATGGEVVRSSSFAFAIRRIPDLDDSKFAITPVELLRVNPTSGTSPVFRSRRDAEIVIEIHGRIPVLSGPDGNPWGAVPGTMFHMSGDSEYFQNEADLLNDGWQSEGDAYVRGGDRVLPLIEGKMIHNFDHRFGTFRGATQAQINKGTLPRLGDSEHDDPDYLAWPRHWVSEQMVMGELKSKWDRNWLLAWRDIARNDEERTLMATALPLSAVGHTAPLLFVSRGEPAAMQANLSSLALDYVVRQKLGGIHLVFGLINQLPVIPPDNYVRPTPWDDRVELRDWIAERVLELSYTSWDMAPYADDLHDDGPPFRWDPERRVQMRAELDAAYLHLYGLTRNETEHVLDSFSVLRKNEEKAFGTFRTRDLVLAAYDGMATGHYVSPLTPPPGNGPRHPDDGRRRTAKQERAGTSHLEADGPSGALVQPEGTLF